MTVEEIDTGAVQMLRYPTLEADYADAWTQWSGDDQQSWDETIGDGVTDAAR